MTNDEREELRALIDNPAVRIVRKPLEAGVLIDEEPEAPPRPRWRRPAIWALRFAMVGVAAAVMYAEGQHQPAPGVWFAVALALMMGAAFVGSRD